LTVRIFLALRILINDFCRIKFSPGFFHTPLPSRRCSFSARDVRARTPFFLFLFFFFTSHPLVQGLRPPSSGRLQRRDGAGRGRDLTQINLFVDPDEPGRFFLSRAFPFPAIYSAQRATAGVSSSLDERASPVCHPDPFPPFFSFRKSREAFPLLSFRANWSTDFSRANSNFERNTDVEISARFAFFISARRERDRFRP